MGCQSKAANEGALSNGNSIMKRNVPSWLLSCCLTAWLSLTLCPTKLEACETRRVHLVGNLDSQSPLSAGEDSGTTFDELKENSEASTTFTVFDSTGRDHTVYLYYFRIGPNYWVAHAYVDGSQLTGGTAGMPAQDDHRTSIYLDFDVNGNLGSASDGRYAVNLDFSWSNGANVGRFRLDLQDITQVENESSVSVSKTDGSTGACPKYAVNDFDGDGTDDVAIWRPDSGHWAIRPSATDPRGLYWIQWGLPGDYPMPGDYTGDGRADLVVWRPSDGTWYVCKSDDEFTCTTPLVKQFGLPGDVPIKGDYDGDGTLDFAVWRPSTGTFYYSSSLYGFGPYATFSEPWGLQGDIPIQAGTNK